ncbi:MAG TPA: RAMP superfamily CRISPR-associated protein [Thermotogota bacterium]|nr:RAMP superfamily CRISPR-associated protein [Thermotogota bacterium]
MFDEILSILTYKITITPQTGFLVSQGSMPLDPSEPDISSMRCTLPGIGLLPYIPGSSIKGPFRAHGESLLRSLGDENHNHFACNIGESTTCGRNREFSRLSGSEKYLKICYACRMFGCMLVASVIRFEDCYPWQNLEEASDLHKKLDEHIIVRNGISIDRNSGKVRESALFYYESVNLPFYGQMVFKNPELWQVALFLKIIDHVNEGFQKFGRAKSRGLGRVEITPTELTLYTKGKKGILFRTTNNAREASAECEIESLKLSDDGWLRKGVVSGEEMNKINAFISEKGIEELLRQTKQVG